jgi:hypothetical protein
MRSLKTNKSLSINNDVDPSEEQKTGPDDADKTKEGKNEKGLEVIDEEKPPEEDFDPALLTDGDVEPFEYDSIASLDSQDFSDYSNFGDREDHKTDLYLNVVRKPAFEISRKNAGSQT